ncbi:MAG: sigma-54-dependent Fis family transcriptional regulator [Gemmatimonadetes bacterium]|jgi:DNA-binding NtrC family response regulator|nr:sigma-54-dependent Fis family transcriptional regulator [Gemmatimonadota bacterium]MBK6456458.1 sigma-54-dependent Fis family transcriptional regulator [Gemmatimonadota bacterium]HNV77137.1 sigma-54 dependent transcriptional regulator [Gemmatimonadaceae bacterium]HPV74638.1 sigma-54 dependent transcriptional regulator [Gemmatimonadaceae bacterium]
MTATRRILVVDDDRAFRLSTCALLRHDGYQADDAADGAAAAEALRARHYDLMLLDLKMPGIDGLQLLETLRIRGHTVPILMISGVGTVELAVRSLHLGADDFLTKPVEPDILAGRVAELLDSRPSGDARAHAGREIIGRAAAMQDVLSRLERVAPLSTTVLISGETGVGKELVARAVHRLSDRRDAAFVAVNCGALSESLLESELFGHARGSFTGAVRDRIGVIESAHGGTLFLDEVGEMSLAVQQRLLRVLQEREVQRVGASRPVPVDIRVVTATNRDLRSLVHERRFREDLYYRLAVFTIDVPPLRDRREDIPLLAQHALERLRARVPQWSELACSPLALRAMRAFDWPGNVRHLLGAIESAAVLAEGRRIELQHLPEEVRESLEGAAPPRYRAPDDELQERDRILGALDQCGGSPTRAADLLGMGRTTLWRKLRALGIDGTDT